MRWFAAYVLAIGCGRIDFGRTGSNEDVLAGSCPAPFLTGTTGCHFASTVRRPTAVAAGDCSALDPTAHLAVIESAEEQAELRALFAPSNFWFGLVNPGSGFVWVTGEPLVGYTDWQLNDPNGEGTCTRVEVNGDKWDDEPCTTMFFYVCELDGKPPMISPM